VKTSTFCSLDAARTIVVRGTLTNQERADQPLTKEQAWTLVHKRTDHYRNVGLHHLIDTAQTENDRDLWHEIGVFMKDEADLATLSIPVLQRFAGACPLSWMARQIHAKGLKRVKTATASFQDAVPISVAA
jgi:hypothetical protein